MDAKLEHIKALRKIIDFDMSRILTTTQVTCPDCHGDVDAVCATCGNTGAITVLAYDLDKVRDPANSFMVKKFKLDAKGRPDIEIRDQDAAGKEYARLMGWDKPNTFGRDSAGRLLTREQIAALGSSVNKDEVVGHFYSAAVHPDATPTEAANNMKNVALLKGYVDEEGHAANTDPLQLSDVQSLFTKQLQKKPLTKVKN